LTEEVNKELNTNYNQSDIEEAMFQMQHGFITHIPEDY